jgi:hypothetical protein
VPVIPSGTPQPAAHSPSTTHTCHLRGPRGFSGFTEVPIGIAWKPAPWATVVVEGGFAIPFNGGYLGVAGAFRL